jgi:hypothetical protein
MRDKGVASPQPTAQPGSTKLTSQLPPSLSPLVRPFHHISPSPRNRHADSSSASSSTSSPVESPHSNPIHMNSPRKGSFNLPPPAHPLIHHVSSPVTGVPIPLIARHPSATPQFTSIATIHSSIGLAGTSIDTLRFGRKPGNTNSVTSPNALLPRCACGKPAGHRDKAVDALDSEFSNLILGPSVTNCQPDSTRRLVSDSAVLKSGQMKKARSGHGTPATGVVTVSSTLGGSLSLTRSRSDPFAGSPTARTGSIGSQRDLGRPESGDLPLRSPRRGRSRERQSHRVNPSPGGLFDQPGEREPAPSRSRNRQERPRYEDSKSVITPVERKSPRQSTNKSPALPSAQIFPAWSRGGSFPDAEKVAGEGVSPPRKWSPAHKSPEGSPGWPVDDIKDAQLKRASTEFGKIFKGLAASGR